MSALEALHHKWNDLGFRDFSLLVQQLGSISSDKVNTVLSAALAQADDRITTNWLRLIVALHFQLGKRAEFTLNDRTIGALLNIIERSVVQQQQQQRPPSSTSISSFLSDLCVILLSLNTTAAATTVGIENQLCALYLVASPEHQRVLLPLVHRSFYSHLRASSLSAEAFNAMIRRQARDAAYHEFLRVFALVNSSAIDDFVKVELLNTSPVGGKPMFGAAPVAVGLDGQKCSNSRLGAAVTSRASVLGKPSDGNLLMFYTVLHLLESPTAAQVQHCYLVSAISNAIRLSLRRSSRTKSHVKEERAQSSDGDEEDKQPSLRHQFAFSYAACVEIAGYLEDIFGQITQWMRGKRCQMFSSKKALGLKFVEGVASDALFLAKHVCMMHKDTDVARDIAAEVTSFLYVAMHASQSRQRPASDEIPELRDADQTVLLGAAIGGSSGGLPLFSPDVMIKCLEFQIAVAPIEEVLNFFGDIFGSDMWEPYLEHHESFALELCLCLEQNRRALATVLPSLAPRVMWLLSQQPHILFPVVKRLVLPMMNSFTSLDIFFRIVFLPLICFSNMYAPPPLGEGDDEDNDSITDSASYGRFNDGRQQEHSPAERREFYRELWDAILDWSVSDVHLTPFAELCVMRGKSFRLWDALHRSMGHFDGRMTIAFRLIRPLLTEFFKATDLLPPQLFSAIRTAYFFMVSPQDQRAVVTDFLLEMGRWVAEVKPEMVQQSTSCLVDMLQQEYIPMSKRSWKLQRWAALVGATGLSQRTDDELSMREAAVYFEVLHVMMWELVALASTVVTVQYQASLVSTGSTERDVCSAPHRKGLPVLQFATSPISLSSLEDVLSSSTPYDGGLAADYLPEAQVIASRRVAWDDQQQVWVAPNGPLSQEMCGVMFTEHMHSLVIALAMLSQICPNVKERGIICLANLIRTLMKSRHAGSQLATTATICLKTLKFPAMNGLATMPLHALLGLQVLRDHQRRSGGGGAQDVLPSCV